MPPNRAAFLTYNWKNQRLLNFKGLVLTLPNTR